jgi:hypothetical protein
VSKPWIDGKLNLKDETDRSYFLKKLEKNRKLPVTIQQVEDVIVFLRDKLDDEWLTVYPFGSSVLVNVKTGARMGEALDFVSIVLRLGFALLALEKLEGFDKLTAKLNHHSHELRSTIVETISAARYKLARCDVELEPSNQRGKFCDFRVRLQDEWIYFECKKENLIESQYFKKAKELADELVDLVHARVGARLPPTHRIEIRLHRKPLRSQLPKLADSISNCMDTCRFDEWKILGETEFAVRSREHRIVPHPKLTMLSGRCIATTTPKAISQIMDILVFFDPFGSKELQKARGLIREARKQLPRDSRSVIILECLHPKRMIKVAEEKLNQAGYGNIIAILVVGDVSTGKERFLRVNAPHLSFPGDFLKIGISPSPI